MSVVRILKKIDHVITTPYCITRPPPSHKGGCSPNCLPSDHSDNPFPAPGTFCMLSPPDWGLRCSWQTEPINSDLQWVWSTRQHACTHTTSPTTHWCWRKILLFKTQLLPWWFLAGLWYIQCYSDRYLIEPLKCIFIIGIKCISKVCFA